MQACASGQVREAGKAVHRKPGEEAMAIIQERNDGELDQNEFMD